MTVQPAMQTITPKAPQTIVAARHSSQTSTPHAQAMPSLGYWQASTERPLFEADALMQGTRRVRETTYVLATHPTQHRGIGFSGQWAAATSPNAYPVLAVLPPLYPEWLGCRSFLETHGVRFPYATGAMANGIATTTLVIAMAKAQMLGFFGAAGLSFERVQKELDVIERALPANHAWGSNLIHSPSEPALENAIADLYVERRVPRVEASAFMRLTASIVHYAYSGVHQDPSTKEIVRPHHVFAKVSRPEVARQFMSPAPASLLEELVRAGKLTPAKISRQKP